MLMQITSITYLGGHISTSTYYAILTAT